MPERQKPDAREQARRVKNFNSSKVTGAKKSPEQNNHSPEPEIQVQPPAQQPSQVPEPAIISEEDESKTKVPSPTQIIPLPYDSLDSQHNSSQTLSHQENHANSDIQATNLELIKQVQKFEAEKQEALKAKDDMQILYAQLVQQLQKLEVEKQEALKAKDEIQISYEQLSQQVQKLEVEKQEARKAKDEIQILYEQLSHQAHADKQALEQAKADKEAVEGDYNFLKTKYSQLAQDHDNLLSHNEEPVIQCQQQLIQCNHDLKQEQQHTAMMQHHWVISNQSESKFIPSDPHLFNLLQTAPTIDLTPTSNISSQGKENYYLVTAEYNNRYKYVLSGFDENAGSKIKLQRIHETSHHYGHKYFIQGSINQYYDAQTDQTYIFPPSTSIEIIIQGHHHIQASDFI